MLIFSKTKFSVSLIGLFAMTLVVMASANASEEDAKQVDLKNSMSQAFRTLDVKAPQASAHQDRKVPQGEGCKKPVKAKPEPCAKPVDRKTNHF